MNKHKKLISILLAMIIILGIAVNVSAKSGIFVGIVSSGGIGITASTGAVHWKHDDHLRHMEDYIDDLSGYSDIPIHAGYFTKAQVLSFLDTADDLFFYRGHGEIVNASQNTTAIVVNEDNNTRVQSSDIVSSLNFSNIKFAAFIACLTAYGGLNPGNLPYKVMQEGADCVLGFSQTIECLYGEDWCVQFAILLKSGVSVRTACQRLESYSCTTKGNYDTWVVFGNGNITLT